MINREDTSIPGCYLINSFFSSDDRGVFVKCITSIIEPRLRLAEVFYTQSAQGVLRGMHLQEPPYEQYKLLFCTAGQAFDVITDLRVGSPTFGKSLTMRLDPGLPTAVLIPPGVAHGFLALADNTTIIYLTSSLYSASHDSGVLWSSLGITWPAAPAIISDRDRALPPLAEYKSPFYFSDAQESSFG